MTVLKRSIQISGFIWASANFMCVLYYALNAKFENEELRYSFWAFMFIQPSIYICSYMARVMVQVFSTRRTYGDKLRLMLATNLFLPLYVILAQLKLLHTKLGSITEIEHQLYYYREWDRFGSSTCFPLAVHTTFQAIPQAIIVMKNNDYMHIVIEAIILWTASAIWLLALIAIVPYILNRRRSISESDLIRV